MRQRFVDGCHVQTVEGLYLKRVQLNLLSRYKLVSVTACERGIRTRPLAACISSSLQGCAVNDEVLYSAASTMSAYAPICVSIGLPLSESDHVSRTSGPRVT